MRAEPVTVASVRAGDKISTQLWIVVAPGHHVQANPAAKDMLRPLTVSFAASDRLKITPIYPAPQQYKLQGADWDLLTYDGRFSVVLEVSVPAGVAASTVELDGTVAYQACNENACLPPSSVPVHLTAQIAPN